jgi:hypothetical protein
MAKKLKALTFDEVMAKAKEKFDFVEETGLCYVCRKNPAVKNPTSNVLWGKCEECGDKVAEILDKLRKIS